MNYKLINKQTGEETLCVKVTIDGFDYYVSDEQATEGFYGYINFQGGDIKKIGKHFADDWKKVIATNNPNIDVPKVVDEVEELFPTNRKGAMWMPNRDEINNQYKKEGYNKSQETHPFSLNDVKEIINLAREQYWDVDNRGFSSNAEGDWSFKYSTEDEIIQKYQETKDLFMDTNKKLEFSEEDMVEFMDWYKSKFVQIYDKKTKLHQISLTNPKTELTTKELLQTFKKQKTKTLYYE